MGIKDLKAKLKVEKYTLVIAKHVIRKVRPYEFFNNAQAAYKKDVKVQETMFFAYPDNVLRVKELDEGAKGLDAGVKGLDAGVKGLIKHNFDEDMTELPMVVDAFAGAYYGTDEWETNSSGGYSNYVSHLLTDHVPMDFIYTDQETKHDCRVVFANTVGLIGSRGMLDNTKVFEPLKFKDLKELNMELLKPLIKGMVKIINTHSDTLQ